MSHQGLINSFSPSEMCFEIVNGNRGVKNKQTIVSYKKKPIFSGAKGYLENFDKNDSLMTSSGEKAQNSNSAT